MGSKILGTAEQQIIAGDVAGRTFGIAAAAERFGVSTSTLKRGVKTGTFPAPIEISDRRVGWLEKDILAWQHQRSAAARAKFAGKGA